MATFTAFRGCDAAASWTAHRPFRRQCRSRPIPAARSGDDMLRRGQAKLPFAGDRRVSNFCSVMALAPDLKTSSLKRLYLSAYVSECSDVLIKNKVQCCTVA